MAGPRPEAGEAAWIAPGLSVRLKLTLSYAGFLMLAGALLLAVVWVFLLRYVPPEATGPSADSSPGREDLERAFGRPRPGRWYSCLSSVCWEAGSSPAACLPH